jgi:hypothetical protein
MGRLVDLFVTYRFIKLLVTPFNKQDAFTYGIIDDKGYRTKKEIETPEEKASYTILHKLIFNIKRLMGKVPGLGSRLGTYAAALFLLKDTFKEQIEDFDQIQKMLLEEIMKDNNLSSEISEDYIGNIPSGEYKLRSEMMLPDFETLAKFGDRIIFEIDASPVDNVLGIDIYEAIHKRTNQPIYVSVDDIRIKK